MTQTRQHPRGRQRAPTVQVTVMAILGGRGRPPCPIEETRWRDVSRSPWDVGGMTSPRPSPREVLTGLWLLTAILTVLPALLLLSFAEDLQAVSAAVLLLLAAVVAFGAAWIRWTAAHGRLQASLVSSVLVMVAAGSALAVLGASGSVGPTGGLLFGGVAIAGGALTGIVAAVELRRDSR